MFGLLLLFCLPLLLVLTNQRLLELELRHFVHRRQLAILMRRHHRLRTTYRERLTFALLLRLWHGCREHIRIVSPSTLVRWHNEKFWPRMWALLSRRGWRGGRRPVDRSIPEIIRRMKQENPGWGAVRICGELRNLGRTCAPNTVRKYLRGFFGTAPTDRWKVFLADHREGLCSMDYFTLPAWRVRQMFVFFVIDHARRKILHVNVTFFPHLEWLKQQLRAAFPGDSVLPYRMLLSDNDTVFRAASIFSCAMSSACGRSSSPRSLPG